MTNVITEPAAAPQPGAARPSLEQRHAELGLALEKAKAALNKERGALADGSGTTESVVQAKNAVDALESALNTVAERQAKAQSESEEQASTKAREAGLKKLARIAGKAGDALNEYRSVRAIASEAIAEAARTMPKQRELLQQLRQQFIQASGAVEPGLVVDITRGAVGHWSPETRTRFMSDLARHGVMDDELRAVTAAWDYQRLQLGNAEAAQAESQLPFGRMLDAIAGEPALAGARWAEWVSESARQSIERIAASDRDGS